MQEGCDGRCILELSFPRSETPVSTEGEYDQFLRVAGCFEKLRCVTDHDQLVQGSVEDELWCFQLTNHSPVVHGLPEVEDHGHVSSDRNDFVGQPAEVRKPAFEDDTEVFPLAGNLAGDPGSHRDSE